MRLGIEVLRVSREAVAHLYRAVHLNSLCGQRLNKRIARELRRILYGNVEIEWLAVLWNRTKGPQDALINLTVKTQMGLGPCGRGYGLVFQQHPIIR